MDKMRVFLVQTAHGLTPSSGGYKANISLLRQLRSFGHECAQIGYGFDDEVEQFAQKAAAKGVTTNVTHSVFHTTDPQGVRHEIPINTFTDEHKIFNIVIAGHPFDDAYPVREFLLEIGDLLEGRTVTDRLSCFMQLFKDKIREYNPTHVIFNDALTMYLSRDISWGPAPLAGYIIPVRQQKFKRVSIIHTAEQLPFGPYCGKIFGHCMAPTAENRMIREVDGVWAVSKAIQSYAAEHGELKTTFMIHSTLSYLDKETGGLPKVRNNVDKYEVGMINPCPHKGLQILLDLAERMPHVQFVTWVSWGSQVNHLKMLRAVPNIRIEPTTSNTDEIWDRIRILLAPSVWLEAWGMVVTEAQLRGIPVIASNAGGLAEAKLDLPYSIPVKLITGEKHDNGDYVTPEQDLEPWIAAIDKLINDDKEYEKLAALTAETTTKWLSGLDERAHEKWLLNMWNESRLPGGFL